MISSGALYFPQISPPHSVWFDRVLLYWDRAAVIVPNDLPDQRRVLAPRVKDLASAGLLSFVDPRSSINDGFRDPIGDENARQLFDALTYAPGLDALRESYRAGNVMRLYGDKGSPATWRHLQQLGLGGPPRRVPSQRWRYTVDVERNTAHLYMAVLAQVLASGRDLDPVTDGSGTLADAHAMTTSDDLPVAERLRLARERLLTVAVPAPVQSTSVSELVAFKERNASLLRRFRERIEDAALQAAREADADMRQETQRRLESRLATEIDELEARMQERRWSIDRAGSIISIATPASASIGGALAGQPAAAVAAASVAVLAIWRSFFTGNRAELLTRDTAFAVRARRRASGGRVWRWNAPRDRR